MTQHYKKYKKKYKNGKSVKYYVSVFMKFVTFKTNICSRSNKYVYHKIVYFNEY